MAEYMMVIPDFFLFLHKKICFGFSLEVPLRELEKIIPELSQSTPH